MTMNTRCFHCLTPLEPDTLYPVFTQQPSGEQRLIHQECLDMGALTVLQKMGLPWPKMTVQAQVVQK